MRESIGFYKRFPRVYVKLNAVLHFPIEISLSFYAINYEDSVASTIFNFGNNNDFKDSIRIINKVNK
jgi:hypothetical protein